MPLGAIGGVRSMMLACVLVMPMLTTTCWSTPRKPLVMTSNFDISIAMGARILGQQLAPFQHAVHDVRLTFGGRCVISRLPLGSTNWCKPTAA